jgi:ubiquinone/menaquinone biosynthesis C-methylase UbiE
MEVGIQEGFIVLDFGCGPGSYILPLAQLVGTTGTIYALDIHPRAIKKVRDIASSISMRLPNIETIESDCETGLSDNSVDVVLLYDTFHDLTDPGSVLKEIHRILKPDGILSFSDHHLEEKDIIAGVTTEGRFKLSKKGSKTSTFLKNEKNS